MSNEPIKTKNATDQNLKSAEKNNEQKKATEDQVIEKDKRKDYDVQATNTKVIPSQK